MTMGNMEHRGRTIRLLVTALIGCLAALALSACEPPPLSRSALSEPGAAPYDERLIGSWYAALQDDEDLAGAFGFELELPEPPFRMILSVGINDGNAGLDFIGIGTNFRTVKRMLS